MANDVKRNDLTKPWIPPSASGSWRVTATWHEEMTGSPAALTKEVRAAWWRLLACLAGLAALALALPRPGDMVAAVVNALAGNTRGTDGTGRDGIATGSAPPGFLDTAQNAVLLAAGLLVWVLLVWVLAIMIIAGLGRLPGAGGRTARKVLRRIAPAAAGRLVIAAVGVTAIAGVSGCAVPDGSLAATVGVANAAAASEPANTPDPSAPLFDIDWPDTLGGSTTAPAAGEAQAPTAPTTPIAPTTNPGDQSPQLPGETPSTGGPTATAPATPSGQADDTPPPETPAATATPNPAATPAPAPPSTAVPGSPPPSASGPAASASTADPRKSANPAAPPAVTPTPGTATPTPGTGTATEGSVTVKPGDTLWAIAAGHLPSDATDAEIDIAWRAWYAANDELIGADPDLIIPGQHLLPGNSETRPSP